MYGKSFESKFEGSMVGAGFHVFAVWDYCITKNRSGVVELNPQLLAFVLAKDDPKAEELVVKAIEYLTRPDSRSRSKAEDGRRLVKEGQFQYRMVNWQSYEGCKSIEDLREYNRRKQAERRARLKSKPLPGEKAYVKEYDQNGREAADEMMDKQVGSADSKTPPLGPDFSGPQGKPIVIRPYSG